MHILKPALLVSCEICIAVKGGNVVMYVHGQTCLQQACPISCSTALVAWSARDAADVDPVI